MTISQALKMAEVKLREVCPVKNGGFNGAELDAEVLLAYVLKKPKTFILQSISPNVGGDLVNKTEIKEFSKLVARRIKHEPVAYLTGHKEFYGLDFEVNRHVLIPRPDSEILVETAINYLTAKRYPLHPTVADIGTGSGCIAIALAKNLPGVNIIATDISRQALKIAKRNAKKHDISINFFHGDLLEPLKNKKIDLIVSNPPYLPTTVIARSPQGDVAISTRSPRSLRSLAMTSGIKHEPTKALYGGKDGLKYYQKLFTQYKKFNFNCPIILEIHTPNCQTIKKLAKDYFPKAKTETKKDLAGLNRVMIVTPQT